MKKNSRYFFNRKRFSNWFFLLFLSIGFTAVAQKEVTGTVTDDTSLTLPGVAVFVKGTDVGTTTDFDGNYTITVPDGSTTLSFSSVGFKDKDEPIDDRLNINVVLEVSNEALEATVVIGYGSRKKQDLTGSVAIVDTKDVVAFPSQSVEQTLQGRAPGVNVSSQNAGEPGAPIRLRIRGASSINASSDPLFVVDGFIAGSLPAPEDIASIQVLKDASSTAIYGSLGANGVVVVTTKKGTRGKTKVEINSSVSLQEVSNTIDLLNAEQFGEYINEIRPGNSLGSFDTDWQDLTFGSGFLQNHQASIAGGGDKSRYYVSTSFFDQEGIIPNTGTDRLSVVANLDMDVNDYFKAGVSTLGRRSNRNGVRTQQATGGSGSAGVVSSVLRFSPDVGVLDENGNFSLPSVGDDIDNPIANATQGRNERVDDLYQANAYTEFQLLEQLKFKSTFGLRSFNRREGIFFPTTLIRGQGVNGLGSLESVKNTNLTTEHYLTYTNDLNFGTLTATGGYSFFKTTGERFGFTGTGFPDETLSFESLDAATDFAQSGVETSFRERTLTSYFARVNLDIQDKYLLTFSGRADGSSTFSRNNKWGYFPSGAFAWKMHNESFLQDQNAISQWKWRVSYGQTGNPSNAAFETIATLESIPAVLGDEAVNAVSVRRFSNDNLKWETVTQFNAGVDLGFVNNRINFVADYYVKTTDDLLFRRPLPEIAGTSASTILQNIGSLENRGIELQLTTKNIVGDFNWTTDINFSHNRNEILELPDNNQDIETGNAPSHLLLRQPSILRKGESVGTFFGFVYDGVLQNGETAVSGNVDLPGSAQYRDINEDGVLNDDDLTIIGDPNPDFAFGINNTFNYKGFDLNIFFQGVYGGDILSYTLLELNTLTGSNNATTQILNRWTPANPNTNIPAAGVGLDPRRISDRWVFDGSYVRLKNLALGYTLNNDITKKLKLSKLRMYISGQNLLTFTEYPGLDPEVSYARGTGNTGNSNLNLGLDYGSFPNVRTFTMGVNVAF